MAKKTYKDVLENCCRHMPSEYKELVLSFAEHLASVKYSIKTVITRCDSVKVFTSFLVGNEAVRIQDVDAKLLEKYRLYLLERKLKENTVDVYMRSVKSLYNYLENSGKIFENPFQNITMHRPKAVLLDVLTVDEVNRFLAAVNTIDAIGLRNRAIIETLYATGLRRGELLSLKTFDVDPEKESVRVYGKGSRERVLPLGRHASEYISLYLKHARHTILSTDVPDNENQLFVGLEGGSPALDGCFFRSVCRKADITKHVSCHTFRRTCATHMLANGAHPLMVAEMLGHSSLKILKQYLKVSIKEIQQTHSMMKPGK